MSSRKRSNKEKRDKDFDFKVISLLQNQGIFNNLRAKTLTNIAQEIQSSSLDSMKSFKTINTDIDNKLAAEIVFEYLKRNKMDNTIRCIQTETQNKLSPKPISNDVESVIGISGKENILHQVVDYYYANNDAIFANYHKDLINNINDRIQNIGKNPPAQKPKEMKSQTMSYASATKSPPKNQNNQLSNTANQVPAKKEESSSEIDFDLVEDTPPPKASPKKDIKASTQQPKKQSESSEIIFDDLDDFDNPNTSPRPSTSKPAANPASKATTVSNVKTAGDSDFSSFNDEEFNDTPPTPKQEKSPNQYKAKNEVDEFLDDDLEPPLINQNQSKTPPNNENIDLSNDIEIDSLQDFSDD